MSKLVFILEDVTRMFGRRFLLGLGLLILAGFAERLVHSQTNQEVPSKTIYFSVTNADGDFITDMSLLDFDLKSKGNSLKLNSIVRNNERMAIGFLVDVSRSMDVSRGTAELLSEGFKRFISLSNEDNEYSLMKFSSKFEVSLKNLRDTEEILEKLTTPFDGPANFSHVYDALIKGCELVEASTAKKKVLVVFSDAMDHGSSSNFSETVKWLEDRDIQIYFVQIASKNQQIGQRELQAQAFSDHISERTGGKSYFLRSKDGLIQILPHIADTLSHQFRAELSPISQGARSKWQEFSIKANLRNVSGKQKLVVHTRAGIRF